MAAVTFSINAVDRTRAAFASINQGLRNLTMGGDAAQRRFVNMGLKMAGVGSVIALLGSQVRKVATDIEKVPGVSRETIDSWNRLKLMASETEGVIGGMVAKAGEGISSLASLIRFGWISATEGINAAQKDLLETDALAAAMRRDSSGAIDKEIESIKKLTDARRELKNIGEGTGASITRRRAEAGLLESQAAKIDDLAKRNDKLTESVKLRTAAEKDMRKLQEDEAKASKAAGDSFGKMMGMTLPLKERIEGLQGAYGRLSVELAKYNDLSNPEHVEKRTELLNEQTRVAEQLTREYERANKFAREAGQAIAGSFEDAVFSGGKLRDMVRGLIADLARLLFRNMITQPLADILGGTSGSKGLLATIFGRASGGPVSAGQPYIVGEQGQELFVPSTAGRIIPNHALGSGNSGGPSYSFNYHFATGVSRSELMPALRQSQRETIAAIADAQRRGRGIAGAVV